LPRLFKKSLGTFSLLFLELSVSGKVISPFAFLQKLDLGTIGFVADTDEVKCCVGSSVGSAVQQAYLAS
jgi:hypothetical protein